ncbi:DUF4906 domain-containing protein [Parabacteroides chongii]|uniref:DUF4906 domain-containing protein n=1 Tax=Parabacteroides chongii TaxID=2685834 RepID=UPI00240E05F4|nr:DUF4906 domain-containing protein [Parabacteroides chongii]WFE83788.1 DUF4906 domain-containing protein [Parabacteroides chongii]
MNKIKIQTILYLLFGICFCSCEKDGLQESTKSSYILLSMPESIDVNTKGDISVPKLGDITISNVWIIQFNAQTSKCVKALYAPQSKITPSENENEKGVIVNLKTGESDNSDLTKFSNVESRFYVIANGGIKLLTETSSDANNMYILEGDELDQLTEIILKAKTIQVGTDIEKPFTTESLSLLTSGPVIYTPKEDGIIKVRTQMFRAFARIKLEISFAGEGQFNLLNSKIYNLPKQMAMYRAGGLSSVTYPEATVGNNTDVQKYNIAPGPFDLNISDLNTGTQITTKTFYMAENLRGVGKSTTQQGKNKKENGPASEAADPLIGCTYIELEGTYKYSTTHTDGVKVKYTFYLGGNFTNDYNIARDYSYELTFNIAGPNSADVRVQITDGNVAVFDEVHVVDNIEVNF